MTKAAIHASNARRDATLVEGAQLWTVHEVEMYAPVSDTISSGLGRGFNVESSL
jgi:hypothetical protein